LHGGIPKTGAPHGLAAVELRLPHLDQDVEFALVLRNAPLQPREWTSYQGFGHVCLGPEADIAHGRSHHGLWA
jgi:hypothetical protein